jgi:TolA-binding protein
MITDNGHIELFERYRNGDLSNSEFKEFEARLVYDSEFKGDYDHYEALEEGIKAHFRNKLKSKLQEMDKMMDNSAIKRSHPKRILIWSSAVAACLLIGVLVLQRFSSNKYELIEEEYWTEEAGLPVKMSSKGKYDDAMNAYKLGEYEKANFLLEKTASDTSTYFQGVIAYKLNDYKASKGFFKQIRKTSLYFHNAQFRLGLILLSEGDLSSAKRIFEMQKVENNLFVKEANEILKKI